MPFSVTPAAGTFILIYINQSIIRLLCLTLKLTNQYSVVKEHALKD